MLPEIRHDSMLINVRFKSEYQSHFAIFFLKFGGTTKSDTMLTKVIYDFQWQSDRFENVSQLTQCKYNSYLLIVT